MEDPLRMHRRRKTTLDPALTELTIDKFTSPLLSSPLGLISEKDAEKNEGRWKANTHVTCYAEYKV